MKDLRKNKRYGEQFAYVLDSVYAESEETGKEITGQLTDKQKVEWVFGQFDLEFNDVYNKRRYPNEQERLANYLQGLPSCINLAFSNYDIMQLGKSWGCCQTEKKAAEFVGRWFSVMALRLLQLRDRLCK